MRRSVIGSVVCVLVLGACNGSSDERPVRSATRASTETSRSATTGSAPATTAVASPTAPALTIRAFRFSPDPLQVRAGSAVIVTNQDDATHTWTSDAGVWDSGPLATGRTATVRFDTPGTFAYHCTIHPTMTGRVIVS